MEHITKQLKSGTEFIVGKEDTNDRGALHICRILRELTGIYDQFVINAFGDLGYYKLLNSSYRLDLTGQAAQGDHIRLDATANVNPGRSVDISVAVYRIGRKPTAIASGHFVFTLQKARKEPVLQNTQSLHYEAV